MKLRFEVDQAEAFRQGIDVPKSIVTVEVDPAKLSQEDRNLIADRLVGIDVCFRGFDENSGKMQPLVVERAPMRIKAVAPTFNALMTAVREDETWVQKRAADRKALIDGNHPGKKEIKAFHALMNECLRDREKLTAMKGPLPNCD